MGADGEFPIFASSSTFPSPARPFRLGTTDVPTFPPVPPLPPTVVAAATAACDTTATCAPPRNLAGECRPILADPRGPDLVRKSQVAVPP